MAKQTKPTRTPLEEARYTVEWTTKRYLEKLDEVEWHLSHGLDTLRENARKIHDDNAAGWPDAERLYRTPVTVTAALARDATWILPNMHLDQLMVDAAAMWEAIRDLRRLEAEPPA